MANEFANILLHISVLAGILVSYVDAHSYVTKDGSPYSLVYFHYLRNVVDWKACEEECRKNSRCQTFIYGFRGGETRICYLTESRSAYGSLSGSGLVAGELASKSNNAPLLWVGIGWPSVRYIRSVYADLGITNMTHAQCQAECDSNAEVVGVECVSYKITTDTGECKTFSSVMEVLTFNQELNTNVGIRDDINVAEKGIVGDVLGTKVPPDRFPLTPQDIGDGVPDYSEIDFHYEKGLKDFATMRTITGTATWQDCSIECHQTINCEAFFFTVERWSKSKKCRLYDALLLGQTEPGFGKYGVIDRSKGEGEVTSLVDAEIANGHNLYWERQFIETMDECAKLCYRFYCPRMCVGFFFDLPNKLCKLYEAIPCFHADRNDKPKALFTYNKWNAVKYRFGYIESRISTSMWRTIQEYGMRDPKAATYETRKEVCRNETASMQIELNGSGGETDGELQLICATHCFAKRQWCRRYQMDPHNRICHLYTADSSVTAAAKNEECTYGDSVLP